MIDLTPKYYKNLFSVKTMRTSVKTMRTTVSFDSDNGEQLEINIDSGEYDGMFTTSLSKPAIKDFLSALATEFGYKLEPINKDD